MRTARVLVVDENDDLLDGLAAWISVCTGFEVAGVAHSAAEALARIELWAPDLVLMNISLPDMSGLDATRAIKARPRAPLVVLMTFHPIGAGRAEALAAGADGCLAKPEIARDFEKVAGALLLERRGSAWAAARAVLKRPRALKIETDR